jgi:beta-galactosidase
MHSYARVYVDGTLAGVMDRRLGQKSLPLAIEGTHQLDVLVENSGRINFKPVIRGERAGVLGDIRYGGSRLTGWKVYPLPFAPPPAKGYTQAACTGPCFYRGTFRLAAPGDTYLNTQQLGKGAVWVNGHLLGRFWNIGPAGTLYLPGVWLHKGRNSIQVLDLDGAGNAVVHGQDSAVYFEPKPQTVREPGATN